ncbi:MAG: helix-turn-helix transcriptional regulator [Nitrospinales bacterium]
MNVATNGKRVELELLFRKFGLTPRETEVAYLTRKGMNDEEIAEKLFISKVTARNHVKKIYKKLGVHSRAQLVVKLNQ